MKLESTASRSVEDDLSRCQRSGPPSGRQAGSFLLPYVSPCKLFLILQVLLECAIFFFPLWHSLRELPGCQGDYVTACARMTCVFLSAVCNYASGFVLSSWRARTVLVDSTQHEVGEHHPHHIPADARASRLKLAKMR